MSKTRVGNVFGLILLGLGVAIVVAILRNPPISVAGLSIGVGLALFGALIVTPEDIGAGFKSVVDVFGPYLPKVKIGKDGDT